MKPGDRNAYVCDTCGGFLLTVDRDEGTTPSRLACRDCRTGTAHSCFYRLPLSLVELEPTHEWYRPSLKWARRQGPEMLDHVRRGGLTLREIDGAS